MKKPLVSIIVPCYKVEQYLPNCIVRVINQTYTNWELILVDDGSPDRCGAICDQYAADNNHMKKILFVDPIVIMSLKSLSSSEHKFMWQDMQMHERYDHIR